MKPLVIAGEELNDRGFGGKFITGMIK